MRIEPYVSISIRSLYSAMLQAVFEFKRSSSRSQSLSAILTVHYNLVSTDFGFDVVNIISCRALLHL